MQTTSLGLGELLRRAKEGSLKIPQFQRSFVWRESQVSLLIDSMSRSYPIGSLLLLDRKPDLDLASRSIEAEIREGYPPDDGTLSGPNETPPDVESYILDGQQRTTAIARVFLNAHPRKLYYFDLKRLLEEHGREETSWIRVRQRGKTQPDRKENNRLLRADITLDQKRAAIYVIEYIEDSGDFPEKTLSETMRDYKVRRREAAARINGVFETMRNYKIPVVTLERDSGVESVCRVFETINSTGTRLTTFDLAVARFYPKPDLRRLWDDAREDNSILKTYEIDGERVLQALYLTVADRSGKYPDPTRSNLLSLSHREIEREWRKSSEALAETYRWARAHGARPKTLPNHNVLVALAAIRNLFSEDASDEMWPDHEFIRRWYFSKIMQAGASQASNYRIGQDFDALRRYVRDGERPEVASVKLNADIVMKLKPSDVRYKALQNVFSSTVRHDLIYGKDISPESVLHDHHVFPKNAGKRHGLPQKMLDGICNRVPVLEKSNLKLNEAYPKEYFREMADQARSQGTLGGVSRRLRDCMIPGDPHDPDWPDSFSIERFEDFCRARAKLIVARVKEVVGDSLVTDISSDEELADDSDV